MAEHIAITGAASGIGRATVAKLLEAGFEVTALDRDAAALATLEAAHPSGLATIVCDVASEESIESAFAAMAERGPRLNGLVLSAGVLRTGRLEDMAIGDFNDLFDVNVRGLWLCARAGMPRLKAAAANGETARIVNLASVAGIRHKVNSGAYAATKAAVIALTKVMAVEMAGDGVLVNAVAPATVDTPMIAPYVGAGSNSSYKTSGTSPVGRIAAPDDIANVISFLLGAQSTYVTGTVIPVDGGTIAAFVPQ
ncbi:MAG: SDR family oxidoreductase [Pseudomonadota bacterium]